MKGKPPVTTNVTRQNTQNTEHHRNVQRAVEASKNELPRSRVGPLNPVSYPDTPKGRAAEQHSRKNG